MKILLIHNFYQYRGGEDVYLSELTNLLKDKGHDIFTFTRDSRDIGSNLLNILKTAYCMFNNIWLINEVQKIISQFKPDVCQLQNIFPLISPSVYQILKKQNIPIVQRISNYRYLCPKAILFRNGKICEDCVGKRFFYPAIIHGCYHDSKSASFLIASSFYYHNSIKSFDFVDRFIFPNEFIRDYYVKNKIIPEKKAVVIPTFVNIHSCQIKKRIKNNYFLFVGRLSEEKGIIALLDIFVSLPKIKLIVIGDGPLKKDVFKYQTYKNIIYKQFLDRDSIYQYMSNAIATIIPSIWYDVLPLVLIESLAAGTLLIVPDFGSFKNLIKQGKTGFFYEYNNLKDLKIKIINAYENQKKMTKIKYYARKVYDNTYTHELHYRDLMKLYQELGN